MTAVEWLVEKLKENIDIKIYWRTKEYIEQAKEMEKEQIIDACMKWYDGINDNAGEQYYNETFKSE